MQVNTIKNTLEFFQASMLVKLFLALLFLYLSGCNIEKSNSKSRSIGAPGELLVVMDQALQNTDVKSVIVEFAKTEFPCIPQSEPTFKMITITPNEFEGHFKAYRNIIIVNHIASVSNEVKYLKNVWANHQHVLKIAINQADDFESFFSENRMQIFDFLYYGDIKSMQMANMQGADAATQQFIKDKFGISMVLPRGYRLVKDTSNFSWFRFDKLETIQGIAMYTIDLENVKSLNTMDLVNIRDSICKTFIPGPYLNTYMTTEKALPVLSNKLIIHDTEVIEIRGLWKVKGYFMGGSFVDYFVTNEKEKKLICIEGFIYAPRKQNKAYYVRQIESVLHSLQCL